MGNFKKGMVKMSEVKMTREEIYQKLDETILSLEKFQKKSSKKQVIE